jgi:hypothetical protein
MHWPKSAPDYKWPRRYASIWMGPIRWILAGAFHAGYALGLLFSLIRHGFAPVLVIRTDGIGDAVLFEPALETLAQAMSPQSHSSSGRRRHAGRHACRAGHRSPLCHSARIQTGKSSIFSLTDLWRIRMGFRMGMCVYDKVVYPADSPEPLGNWLFASVRASERWINYGDTDNQFEWQRQRAQQVASFIIEKAPGKRSRASAQCLSCYAMERQAEDPESQGSRHRSLAAPG